MQAVLGSSLPVASLVFGAAGDFLSPRTLCLVQGAGLLPAALALALLGSRTPAPSPGAATPAPSPGAAAERDAEPVGGER
ncbi:hypothetical protein [Streptomyces cirratus]